MFKNASTGEVVFYAIAAAILLCMLGMMAERIYVISTRPPGHECKEGETKPRAGSLPESVCYDGYWEFVPPGFPLEDKKK
jgi:hypothetical protein